MRKRDRRPIPGYEGYYDITDDGHVFSVQRVIMRSNGYPQTIRAREKKTRINTNGYVSVQLRRDAGYKEMSVHRLVMLAFKPEGWFPGADVNHTKGIKTDNRLGKLEWSTRSQNVIHAFRVLGRKPSGATPIESFDIATGKVIKRYPTCRAAISEGHNMYGLRLCLRGHKRTHNGVAWRYSDGR